MTKAELDGRGNDGELREAGAPGKEAPSKQTGRRLDSGREHTVQQADNVLQLDTWNLNFHMLLTNVTPINLIFKKNLAG